uniref:Transcriptional regulator n=1 Tax=Desulfovibrio sp. U5L TaxID=596152 RepID=I2PX53_9BACT
MDRGKCCAAAGRPRDREATKRLLVEAVGRVLARQGFRAVKVNVVAREAGVDKVLIYRYFDGLPGLVAAFAHSGDFWPESRELAGGDEQAFMALPFVERLVVVTRNYLRGLRRRPLTQEILAWRFMEQNELTEALDSVRQSVGIRILTLLQSNAEVASGGGGKQSLTALLHNNAEAAPGLDITALYVILGSVINHLGVRGRTEKYFAGLQLDDERLEAMLERIIHSLFTNSS